MYLINQMAVVLGVLGTVIILSGGITYLTNGRNDPGVLNPKYGFLAHTHFLFGGSLVLLCWILKLVVYWVDPSVPGLLSRWPEHW
jgi:hypothetical protein